MKSSTYNNILLLGVAVLLFLFTSCSSDDSPIDTPEQNDGKVNVTLCLSAVSPNTDATRASWTRATTIGTDNGNSSEWMHNYTIVIVDNSNNVEKIITRALTAASKEETINDVTLTAGTKTIYSFANINLSDIDNSIKEGSAMPDLSKKTFATNGNFTTIPEAGIPMSNKQTVTIAESGEQTVTLWTVRLYAKIEVQVTNSSSEEMTLNSITLSDITEDGQSIYLLPNPLEEGSTTTTGQQVNMPDKQSIKDYTYTCGDNGDALSTDKKIYTFYVNESKTPTNNGGLFMLTLNLTTNSGKIEEKRYALITDNDNHNWNYIARNDYRIIPITLSAYSLSLSIKDFTAIGISTTVVEGTENMFKCTFYKGNTHFHIIPTVTYNGTALTYSSAETLSNSQWGAGSFTTTETETSGLYASSTAKTDNDGSLNGGVPVWDSSKGFLFGKTASSMTNGTTVNHTLTVKVKNNAGNTSELTYKLKMVAGSISNQK